MKNSFNCSCTTLAAVAGMFLAVSSATLAESSNPFSNVMTDNATNGLLNEKPFDIGNDYSSQSELKRQVFDRVNREGKTQPNVNNFGVEQVSKPTILNADGSEFEGANPQGDGVIVRDTGRATCACPDPNCPAPGVGVTQIIEANEGLCFDQFLPADPLFADINGGCIGLNDSNFGYETFTIATNTPAMYQVCGTTGIYRVADPADPIQLDFDIFRVTLLQDTELRVTNQVLGAGGSLQGGNFGFLNDINSVIDPGAFTWDDLASCADITFNGGNIGLFEFTGSDPGTLQECETFTTIDLSLPAGEYYLLMTAAFLGTPCSSNYTVDIEVLGPAATGACCNTITGVCSEGLNQFACTLNGGIYSGDGSLCADAICCNVDVGTPDTQDTDEPCSLPIDPDLNGGCLTDGGFMTVTVDTQNDVVAQGSTGSSDNFGAASTGGFAVDADAYQFTLTTATDVTVTLETETAVNAFLNLGTRGTTGTIVCGASVTVDSIVNDPTGDDTDGDTTSCVTSVMSARLPAGVHYVDIFSDFTFGIPCDAQYTLTFRFREVNTLQGACITPMGVCTDNSNFADCLAAGGLYQGD
ncbi:MAG: hypothetical protein AAFY28_16555, partial [Actinomycetota bacterium]